VPYDSNYSFAEWQYNTNGVIISSPVITTTGDVIFSSFSNNLYSVSSTGSLNWIYNFANTLISVVSTPALDSEDNIYVGLGSQLYSITKLGSIRWLRSGGSDALITSSPTVYKGLVYLCSTDGYFHAFNSTTGAQHWNTTISDEVDSSPAITYDNSIIILDNGSGGLKSISLTGEILWENFDINPNHQEGLASPSVGVNGIIYIPVTPDSISGVIYALYPNGTMYWHLSFTAVVSATVAVGGDGTLYVGCRDKNFYSISPEGSVKWKYYAGYVISSSAAIYMNESLYFVSSEIFSLTLQGSLLWKYDIENLVAPSNYFTSSPAIGANGMIYVGSKNKYLYALNSRRLAASYYNDNSSTTKLPLSIGAIIGISIGGIIVLLIMAYGLWLYCLKYLKLRLQIFGASQFGNSSALKMDRVYTLSRCFEDPDRVDHGDADGEKLYHRSMRLSKYLAKKQGYQYEDAENDYTDILIPWNEIELNMNSAKDTLIIGSGSFGTVIKASWRRRKTMIVPGSPGRSSPLSRSGLYSMGSPSPLSKSGLYSTGSPSPKSVKTTSVKAASVIRTIDVAVKVYINDDSTSRNSMASKTVERAWMEWSVLHQAERKILSDCIVKAYGVAEGLLPQHLASVFSAEPDVMYVGLVMRYEAGGSLDRLLYPQKGGKLPLSLEEKIRILDLIARAIVELHRADIVHGDLKPANVLLSHHTPPEIRLADFGLSTIRETNEDRLSASTLQHTMSTKGTKLYCAPEMLVNPFNESFDETVATSSRKTDMYAFGILAWEVLCREKPFSDIRSDGALCAKVHQGVRPPISNLPPELHSTSIIEMIECCWCATRSLRKSAVECFSILNQFRQTLELKHYDVFFSHAWRNKPFLSHVHTHLVRLGYQVWYDQNEMKYDMKHSMRQGIMNSSVVLVCMSEVYQSRDNCMFELREAASMDPPKPIVPLIIQASPEKWASEELFNLCKIKVVDGADSAPQYLQIDDLAQLPWADGDITSDMLAQLEKKLEPLLSILSSLGCNPTLKAT
jgi:serine/threonine protein kinase/outer membrane protein assembly factor BamB